MYLSKLWHKLFTYLFFTTRPVLKWFLHRFTCLCELQRICYGVPSGSQRAKAIENSLGWSRTPELQSLTQALDETVANDISNEEFTGEVTERALETVLRVKRITEKANPDFGHLFETCVEQIWGYRRLVHMVEARRRIPFEGGNAEHENKLLELWSLLMPDTELEGRITKQWQDIGFQVGISLRQSKTSAYLIIHSFCRATTQKRTSEEWGSWDWRTCSSSPGSTRVLPATLSRIRCTPSTGTRSPSWAST